MTKREMLDKAKELSKLAKELNNKHKTTNGGWQVVQNAELWKSDMMLWAELTNEASRLRKEAKSA